MILLGAHKKRFKMESLKTNVAMARAKEQFVKINKSMEGMESHRRRSMMIGYYLTHTADLSPDEAERVSSFSALNTLHHGFNNRKIRKAHHQSGLGNVLKITFEKYKS